MTHENLIFFVQIEIILNFYLETNLDLISVFNFEAPVGFEPTNKGFADPHLKPLGYSAIWIIILFFNLTVTLI